MAYPLQIQRTYVNPEGDVIASGLYRSHLTQDIANDFPTWMHLRQNPRSVGQQLMGAVTIHMDSIEKDLEDNIKSKFINTANVGEIDVIYRSPVPSDVDLTDASASGVRCIAAPEGCSPSGVSQIWVKESANLEDFYYNRLPTGMQVVASGSYTSSVDGIQFVATPSGIKDTDTRKFDVWKMRHDLTWCFDGGAFRKQDAETMEDYEVYPYSDYTVLGMSYKNDMLWCIGKDGSNYSIILASTKTQEPPAASLDVMAEYDISGIFPGFEPSGVLIGNDNTVWVCDTGKSKLFEVSPRYDYFILEKGNRQVYFREDYTDSGVFISNT